MPKTQQSANNFFDRLCKGLIWIQSFHVIIGKTYEQTSDDDYEQCDWMDQKWQWDFGTINETNCNVTECVLMCYLYYKTTWKRQTFKRGKYFKSDWSIDEKAKWNNTILKGFSSISYFTQKLVSNRVQFSTTTLHCFVNINSRFIIIFFCSQFCVTIELQIHTHKNLSSTNMYSGPCGFSIFSIDAASNSLKLIFLYFKTAFLFHKKIQAFLKPSAERPTSLVFFPSSKS